MNHILDIYRDTPLYILRRFQYGLYQKVDKTGVPKEIIDYIAANDIQEEKVQDGILRLIYNNMSMDAVIMSKLSLINNLFTRDIPWYRFEKNIFDYRKHRCGDFLFKSIDIIFDEIWEIYHEVYNTQIGISDASDEIRRMATCIRLDKDIGLIPILADACEEVGMDIEVINHLRQKEHSIYCWVVDKILSWRVNT